jgi:thioesterase domain-containing protein/acyl carrier protein
MLPSEIIRTDKLPRSSNGKPDRLGLENAVRPPAGRASFETETERRLAEIWGKLLDVSVVGRDSDFENLGGDSLSVMLLTLEIEGAFDKIIPPADLLAAASLKGQAALIDGTERFERMLTFNPHGDGPPLFFAHTANSGAEVYREFSARLPKNRSFHVFENYNMLFSRGKFEGIARLAHRYADYLPPLQYYHLGGWSLGGLIAFEMGLILQTRGIESELYLIDPYIITSDAERRLNLALRHTPHYREYLKRDPLFERFRDAGRLERLLDNNSFVQREVMQYIPSGKFYGKTTLFRMTKQDISDSKILNRLWALRRPDNGFGQFAGDLRICRVDSTHDGCMSDPQAIEMIISAINKGESE